MNAIKEVVKGYCLLRLSLTALDSKNVESEKLS